MESTSIGNRCGLSQSAIQQLQKQQQQQTQFFQKDDSTSRYNNCQSSPLFPHFPPPPEYPPPGEKTYDTTKPIRSSHRYPDDPDIIEICIEPDPDERGLRNGKPKAKTRTTVNYAKSPHQMGDQPVRWSRNNIAVTMERFEPSPTSSITPPHSSSPVPTPPLPSQGYHTMHHLHQSHHGSSSYRHPHPHEYSYAYYEPGAHLSHTMRQTTLQMAALSADPGPSRPPPPNSMRALMNTASRKNSPSNRHMYINHYGTQENVYEEIANDPRMRIMSAGSSMVSLNQSMVEEEFRRIQSRHRRILGELNLSVEAMLMPETPPSASPTRDPDPTNHDNLTELLNQVGPTDELLSPVSTSAVNGDMDSGFSGSSSSASYVGSLRYHRSNGGGGGGGGTQTRSSTPSGGGNTSSHSGSIRSSQRSTDDSGITTTASRSFSSVYEGGKCATKKASCDDSDTSKPQKISFWSRKGWRKIPGFSSTTSVNKAGLANDEPKLNPGSWEDPLPRTHNATVVNYNGITNNSRRSTDLPLTTTCLNNRHNNNLNAKQINLNNSVNLGNNTNTRRRLEHTPSARTISSEESWCSEGVASDRELSSDEDDESDRSISSSTPRNSQLRLTFNKAKQHLSFDKWRNNSNNNSTNITTTSNNNNPSSLNSSNSSSASSNNTTMPSSSVSTESAAEPFSRLSRWFSMRRGSTHQQYDLGSSRDSREGRASSVDHVDNSDSQAAANRAATISSNKMPQLNETDEDSNSFTLGLFNVTGRTNGTLIATAGATLRNVVRTVTPSLPPAPAGLSQQELKRRHIVAAIVHSENSYVATLQRLVNDYKKPLEESSPPILSSTKISTLFHRLPEILQCHTLFRIALADCVRNWDRDEKLGDVFIAAFSKTIVLDVYSGFINNFSVAMDLAKMEAKRKSALADFFKVKQISAHDRLSFFGLMVKPVQRFPQFILFLQDLLKHTPQGHHDRMSLQLALTQLESLAEMLNERKREAEQYQAFREMLGHISGTFNVRALANSDGAKQRHLLREDNLTQLEFNASGFMVKSKQRRLLLLNDRVICVSVAPKQSADFGASEKLSFKWMYPVTDVEIVDNSTSATLSRILTAGMNKGGSLRSNSSFTSDGNASHNSSTPGYISGQSNNLMGADNLCTEMSNLMHDYEVMSRINDLVKSLKGNYKEVNLDVTKKLLANIQSSIQKKDEEMAWVDSCLLQLVIRSKSGKEETFTFQTESPSVKKEWITELRLAQLALDPNNSPAWEIPENEHRPLTKLPLFVRSQSVYKSQHQTEVRCGCYYSTKSSINSRLSTKPRNKTQNYLWLCSIDGNSSHISLLSQHHQQAGVLKDIGSFDLPEVTITAMEFVKGVPATSVSSIDAKSDQEHMDCVWMATDNKKVLIYLAHCPEREEQVAACSMPAVANHILYHMDNVFVALVTGSILIFRRNSDKQWNLKDYQQVAVSSQELITSLLPINGNVYAACGRKVWVINGYNGDLVKSFEVKHGHNTNLNLMAHSGVGLWISLKNSSVICLYHTESFKHLQDINIASNVLRVTSNQRESINSNNNNSSVFVTALMACKGLLWVGTNVGIALTIPLPRLEGVPIISGAVNISYHAHFGPISFFLPLLVRSYNFPPPPLVDSPQPLSPEPIENPMSSPEVTPEPQNESTEIKLIENAPKQVKYDQVQTDQTRVSIRKKLEKEFQENGRTSKISVSQSPVVQRRRKVSVQDLARGSKTLPRGLGSAAFFSNTINSNTSSIHSSDHGCDVYGLYGDLIFVKEDYDAEEGQGNLMDPTYESLRRSDPELAAIPGKMSTLDRRLKMKVSRPRSLDLSNWSVDSRSSSMYTSSGSEESMGVVKLFGGGSVSRNSSNASHKFNGGELSNICENKATPPDTPPASEFLVPTETSKSISLNSPPEQKTTTANEPSLSFPLETSPSVTQMQNGMATLKRNGKKQKQQPELHGRRTVLTLMGGRGYINWRHVWFNTQDTPKGHSRSNSISVVPKLPNGNDAHIVIWEKKL